MAFIDISFSALWSAKGDASAAALVTTRKQNGIKKRKSQKIDGEMEKCLQEEEEEEEVRLAEIMRISQLKSTRVRWTYL